MPELRVRHSSFGEGVVLRVEGQTVTVLFDNYGTKRLHADLARLEVLPK